MKWTGFLKLVTALSALWLGACESTSLSSSSDTASTQQSSSSSTSPASSSPSSNGLPSNDNSPTPGDPGDTENTDSTSEERIGELDQQLDESLAEFDSTILEQQASAATLGVPFDPEQSNGSPEGDEYSDEEALFEEGDLNEGLPGYGENPSDAYPGEENTAGSEGDDNPVDIVAGDNSAQTTSTSGTGIGTIPVDIPGGSDDDIVARQIREAAMKEKDPALREKLWDEYRKYKNQ